MTDTVRQIKRIEREFADKAEPFDDIEFPEERLLSELRERNDTLSMEARLKALSFFSTLDYNRNAEQLVDNLIALYEFKPEWFDAYKLPNSEKSVQHVFKELGFRYGNRDATTWLKNNQILREKYHGEWIELVLDTGADAPSLVEQLREDDFLCIKGDKIAPMYTRFIDQYVAPLSNVWELEIPVDTHIRRLSHELIKMKAEENGNRIQRKIEDDDVREFWRDVAGEHDVARHVVDGALWQIGNNWDEWGENYWEDVTNV